MKKQIRLIQAFALGIVVLSIPTLATAATINVVTPALLVAKSVGALVSVEVTCDPSFGPGSHLFANVTLFQRSGNRVTQGSNNNSGTDTINCDGTPQTFQILVPSSSGRIFHQGPAIAQAFANIANPDFSSFDSASVTQEIELVRQ